MGIQDVEQGAGGVQDQTPGADGKRYIKISVPNFNGDADRMGSYLRIGATEPGITPGVANTSAGTLDNTGEDLAAHVMAFTDDTRDRGGGPGDATHAPPDAPIDPFPASTPAGELPPPATVPGVSGPNFRQKESSRLHTKGGWRDHSDGNRVTTTRGDKVEIIRGNYKMVVLGRTDNILNAQGREISGGVLDDSGKDLGIQGTQAGLEVLYQWQFIDGVWRWNITNTTGNPAAADNTAVTYNTWVYTSDTNLGSSAQWAKRVTNTTWAHLNNTTTWGENINSTTNASVDIFTEQAAGFTITEVDLAPLITQTQIGVGVVSGVIGVAVDAHVGPHIDIHLPPIVGPHVDFHWGSHIDTTTGPHMETHHMPHTDTHNNIHTDTHLLMHFDNHFIGHSDINNGDALQSVRGDSVQLFYGRNLQINYAGYQTLNMPSATELHMSEAEILAVARAHHLM
jgi:hypothetical protein